MTQPPNTAASGHHEPVREISRLVLAELAPEEVELALGFLDPMIEMAAGGEVLPVDSRGDHVGGFGDADLLALTVVPAVFKFVTRLFENGSSPGDPDAALRKAAPEIAEVARRVGSPRAAGRLPELTAAIREAARRYFETDEAS